LEFKSNKIIGSGDIATMLSCVKSNGLTFFASGVSNSKEIRESEYKREEDLLLDQNKTEHIVYFSSLCVLNSGTRYSVHKQRMEELVKQHFGRYTIVRIGNITWGNNPHTIINYFKKQISAGETPTVIKDEYRHLINEDEFLYWMNLIPERSIEMNLTGRMIKVRKIIEELS